MTLPTISLALIACTSTPLPPRSVDFEVPNLSEAAGEAVHLWQANGAYTLEATGYPEGFEPMVPVELPLKREAIENSKTEVALGRPRRTMTQTDDSVAGHRRCRANRWPNARVRAGATQHRAVHLETQGQAADRNDAGRRHPGGRAGFLGAPRTVL